MTAQEIVQLLIDNWYIIVTTAISIASVVAAGVETPDPNSRLGKLYKVVDLVAINVGKAKNKGVPKS